MTYLFGLIGSEISVKNLKILLNNGRKLSKKKKNKKEKDVDNEDPLLLIEWNPLGLTIRVL
jgi:hypothetical protein